MSANKPQRKQKTQKDISDKAQQSLKKTAQKEFYDNPTPAGDKPSLEEFPPTYSPPRVEAAWYQWWNKQGYFSPDRCTSEKTFTIVLPPPNVTGELHLGHALTSAIEDSITRYHRMLGEKTIWIPGTDHAGIATQVRVEKKIQIEKNLHRKDYSREYFLEEAHKWTEVHGGKINDQLKFIGSSLDWQNSYFTLDDVRSKAVTEAFIRLFNEKKIYRSERLVNWDCALQTAISDAEVEYETLTKRTLLSVPGHKFEKYPFGVMSHFYYQIADENGNPTSEKIEIATTRLETLLGDSAVAIHSKDERYTHLHGKSVYHPFRKCTIPIICDDILVDKEFGTGVVKVTPAHDPNDFLVGQRHNLPFINILTVDGKINSICPEFEGLPRFDARVEIRKAMTDMGLFKGETPHEMRLGITQRGHDIVEQVIKFQWFVDTKEMADKAIEAVDTGALKITPEEFVIDWKRWHENIRPWCISRQLWWGHRIPAYKVSLDGIPVEGENEWVAAHNQELALELASQKLGVTIDRITVAQDEDVLDTWFSSALLPFSAVGWPDQESVFFPNSVLETGWDILTFWVSRMVMMSISLTGKVPFHTVLLHPLVRDAYGRKMSKSLGNVIDPLLVIRGAELEELLDGIRSATLDQKEKDAAMASTEKEYGQGIPQCGTDAMRMALIGFAGANRTANLNLNVIVSYRNFCNKLWNSIKFSMPNFNTLPIVIENLRAVDRWILKSLNKVVALSKKGFEDFRLGDVVSAMVHFYHDEFCSVYLEAVKRELKEGTEERKATIGSVLYEVVESSLRLFHPFMPFVTEDLWQRLPRKANDEESIMISRYPEVSEVYEGFDEELMSTLNNISAAIRRVKTVYNVKVSDVEVLVCSDVKGLDNEMDTVAALGTVDTVRIVPKGLTIERGFTSEIVSDVIEVRVNLKGLVDFEEEITKQEKKAVVIEESIAKIEEKRSKPAYEKVPEKVREGDSERLQSLVSQLAAIKENVTSLKSLNE